jgi:hypothetical protein
MVDISPKAQVLAMGSLVESFLTRKGRGNALRPPPPGKKKLLRKMPLMRRKVPSASIVRNMGT